MTVLSAANHNSALQRGSNGAPGHGQSSLSGQHTQQHEVVAVPSSKTPGVKPASPASSAAQGEPTAKVWYYVDPQVSLLAASCWLQASLPWRLSYRMSVSISCAAVWAD